MSAVAIPAPEPSANRKVAAIVGLLAVAVVAVGASLVLADTDRRSEIEAVIGSPIGLAALFVFSALSSATLLLPLPGMALTVLAATVADPLVVGIAAGAGQAIGELTGYMAGASGSTLVGERLATSRLTGWMRRYGVPTIFVLAVVPNPVFDMAGALAGALRMPIVHYLGAAGAGKIVRNTLIAIATAQGGTLLTGTLR